MKKLLLILLSVVITIILCSCGDKPTQVVIDNDKSETSEAITTISKTDEKVEAVEDFIKSKLKNNKYVYCGISKKNNFTIIATGICDELSDVKAAYYDFANDTVKLVNKASEKYHLKNIFIDVHYLSDDSSEIYWTTDNLGITGEYVTSFKNSNYYDTQYFSLKDLKEYSKSYLY